MAEFPFDAPLPWLWSCHHCHARYPLGVTRRCLHDGHYFCGGTTVSAITGRPIKRHRACGSEFDYMGWEDVSRWQRRVVYPKLDIGERLKRQNSCEFSCEYPSACHHRSKNPLIRKRSSASNEELGATSRANVNNLVAGTKTDFDSFLDPSCLETEPAARALRAAENNTLAAFPAPKSSESLLKKMIKSARRSTQGILSSVTEEDTIEYALGPTSAPSSRPLSSSPSNVFASSEPVGAMASARELGLVIPSLELSTDLPSFFSPESSSSSSDGSFAEEDFSVATSLETHSDEDLDYPETLAFKSSSSHSVNNTRRLAKPPHISLHLDDGLDDMSNPPDIDMTDRIPDSPTSPTSPSTSSMFTESETPQLGGLLTPRSPDSPSNPLFRHKDTMKNDSDQPTPPSPLSPRRDTWNWMTDSGNESSGEDSEDPETTPSKDSKSTTKANQGLGLDV